MSGTGHGGRSPGEGGQASAGVARALVLALALVLDSVGADPTDEESVCLRNGDN
ncbi:MAG: hypothetical protein HND57_11575 [Planctomycetes bacterium]|nr:hypothetical protein [Planctomycetota bacterium]